MLGLKGVSSKNKTYFKQKNLIHKILNRYNYITYLVINNTPAIIYLNT